MDHLVLSSSGGGQDPNHGGGGDKRLPGSSTNGEFGMPPTQPIIPKCGPLMPTSGPVPFGPSIPEFESMMFGLNFFHFLIF